MTSRRRKGTETQDIKLKKNAKTKFVIMIISVILMIFSVTQVYYLAKYTLGYEVASEKLKVYRWVQLLLSGDAESNT